MKLVKTKQLSLAQRFEVQRLLDCGHQNEPASTLYPAADSDCHYLLSSDEGELFSILAAIKLPDDTLETIAYTRPDQRRKGSFTMLLEACIQDYPETDLIFPVNHHAADALLTMAALEAECLSTEYRMERNLQAPPSISSTSPFVSLTLLVADEHTMVLFNCDHTPVGYCKVTASGSGFCLHEVEVNDNCQGQGYGTAMVTLLLENLTQRGATSVFLHVSQSNIPACSLYQKTGFQITETLSYFLY